MACLLKADTATVAAAARQSVNVSRIVVSFGPALTLCVVPFLASASTAASSCTLHSPSIVLNEFLRSLFKSKLRSSQPGWELSSFWSSCCGVLTDTQRAALFKICFLLGELQWCHSLWVSGDLMRKRDPERGAPLTPTQMASIWLCYPTPHMHPNTRVETPFTTQCVHTPTRYSHTQIRINTSGQMLSKPTYHRYYNNCTPEKGQKLQKTRGT